MSERQMYAFCALQVIMFAGGCTVGFCARRIVNFVQGLRKEAR